MSQSENLNEWGIPDWRDAANYGETRNWSLSRWRWEFFRRNDELRAYFVTAFNELMEIREEYYAELTSRDNSFREPPNLPYFLPHERGFTLPLSQESLTKFGYRHLADPRIPNQMEWAIEVDVGYKVHIYQDSNPWEDGTGIFGVKYTNAHLAVGFRLDQPLNDQLKQAKDTLELMQKNVFGKKLQTKRFKENWILYLRVLDARADGASLSQIAKLLPVTLSRTAQNARDVLKQAKALCSNF